jgi:hypothetical protein
MRQRVDFSNGSDSREDQRSLEQGVLWSVWENVSHLDVDVWRQGTREAEIIFYIEFGALVQPSA